MGLANKTSQAKVDRADEAGNRKPEEKKTPPENEKSSVCTSRTSLWQRKFTFIFLQQNDFDRFTDCLHCLRLTKG